MKDNILKLLADLAGCISTSDRADEIKRALQKVQSEFAGDFFGQTIYRAGQPILILSNVQGRNFDFIFAGHIDVVAGNAEAFRLKIKKDRIYGRGTRDMKGPLLAGIYAIRDWLKIFPARLRVAIIISADEEMGGASMRALLAGGRYRAKFALLPDGGDENELIIQQKGFLQLKITINGNSAHASTPYDGDNPIEKVFILYQYLHKIFPPLRQLDDWRTSVVLTKVRSGESINQIPDCAQAWFDIRYIKSSHYRRIIKAVKTHLGHRDSCEIVVENGAFFISARNQHLHKLARAIKKITGRSVKLTREAGTSDAVFFTENNIPAALFWPQGGGVHQREEWVSHKSLQRFYKIIYSFLESF